MKRFIFPLEHVLDYRRVHLQIEESKLQQLHAELNGIEGHAAALAADLAMSQRALVTAPSVTATEFATLDTFRRYTAFETVRADRARVDCRRRITVQTDAALQRRRDVRLLENLRDRRLRTWKAGLEKEIQQQAEESFLARVARRSVRPS
jgi:hypothetical protein